MMQDLGQIQMRSVIERTRDVKGASCLLISNWVPGSQKLFQKLFFVIHCKAAFWVHFAFRELLSDTTDQAHMRHKHNEPKFGLSVTI